jgi:hypothetical protein
MYMRMYVAGGDLTMGPGGLREEKKGKMTGKMSNYIYTHTKTHTHMHILQEEEVIQGKRRRGK